MMSSALANRSWPRIASIRLSLTLLPIIHQTITAGSTSGLSQTSLVGMMEAKQWHFQENASEHIQTYLVSASHGLSSVFDSCLRVDLQRYVAVVPDLTSEGSRHSGEGA